MGNYSANISAIYFLAMSLFNGTRTILALDGTRTISIRVYR